MNKDEALKLALEALNDPSVLNGINNAKFFIKQALAQPPLPPQPAQEPERKALQMCLEYIETNAHERKHVRHAIQAALALPPLPAQERNFCSRCGKRTADLTAIHTCTPPKENT